MNKQNKTSDSNSGSKLNRRSFLTAAAVASSSVALGREYGPDSPPQRYPDPDIVSLDKRFDKYRLGTTSIRRLYTSRKMMWAEGPAWNGVGRYLVWSDIPNNVQMRWLEEDGHVSVFRQPAGHSNGNTIDQAGLWEARPCAMNIPSNTAWVSTFR